MVMTTPPPDLIDASPLRSWSMDSNRRGILPRCLEQRPPARYEIWDVRKKMKVRPAVDGYRLRPNSDYELRVWIQHGEARNFPLQPVGPRSPAFVKWQPGEGSRDGYSMQPFCTTGVRRSQLWLLDNPVGDLIVQINSTKQDAFQLQIPVVLANRWLYAPAAVVALLSMIPAYRWLQMSWEAGAFLAFLILLGGTALCYCLDLWRSYVRARALIATLDCTWQRAVGEKGSAEPAGNH